MSKKSRSRKTGTAKTEKWELSAAKRKAVFTLLTLSLPFVALFLLETGLHVMQYGGDLRLFVSGSGEYSDYLYCNPRVGNRYFFMQSLVPDTPNDIFLKQKPANAYRIFVLGASTAAGFPYGNNLMFSRILHQRLSETFPQKHIEVINTATSAINSYTLLDFMDEILQQQPDALLIYAGHNEYYGALGVASSESLGRSRWFIKFYLKLKKYKTVLFIRDTVSLVRGWVQKLFYGSSAADPSATLMEKLVAEQKIVYQDPLYELGKTQFEENLDDILDQSDRAGVKVVISDLVSNIRDQAPFISVENGETPPAELIYQQAVVMEKEGKFKEARELYYQAKELDALRFRAPQAFNDIIHRVAGKYGIPVVPMQFWFDSASPNGLIGDNLMTDQLHPNIKGNFLMADAFYETMKKNQFIGNSWGKDQSYSPDQFRHTWGYTALDSAYADIRIHILKAGWPFQPAATTNKWQESYRPKSEVEIVAVRVRVDDTYSLEDGHADMAEFHKKNGDFYLAYKEYHALRCLKPYNFSAHLNAGQMLLAAGDTLNSIPLFKKSLQLKENIYANTWLGTILVNQNRVNAAIPYLKKAQQLAPGNPDLLYNLSRGYLLNGQYFEASETLNVLKEVKLDYPHIPTLQKDIEAGLKTKSE